MHSIRLALLGALCAVAACSTPTAGDPGDGDATCTGGKCDDPGQLADRECGEMCGDDRACFQECRDAAALEHCELRRADALDSAQQAFTEDHIRWACADVEGVNTNIADNRGQEYCEYFAVVQPPPAEEGGALPEVVTPGKLHEGGTATDPLSIELSEDQIFALEDEPDAIVGQCVFTSWHQDIEQYLPVCGDSEVTCPLLSAGEGAQLPSWQDSGEYAGVPLTESMMRMKVTINSNFAAADLFQKCLADPPAGDPARSDDPLHDDYVRGCWGAYQEFQTEWRRSDPSVCAVATRLNECGCGVDTDADGVADIVTDDVDEDADGNGFDDDIDAMSRALVPHQPGEDGSLRLRGFHLGTWSDPGALPTGCRYVDTGDTESTKTLVACDLTAADLLASASDPKGRCREKYGDNVVVHVPIPADSIVCTPPEGGQYAGSCTDMPWVLGAQ